KRGRSGRGVERRRNRDAIGDAAGDGTRRTGDRQGDGRQHRGGVDERGNLAGDLGRGEPRRGVRPGRGDLAGTGLPGPGAGAVVTRTVVGVPRVAGPVIQRELSHGKGSAIGTVRQDQGGRGRGRGR